MNNIYKILTVLIFLGVTQISFSQNCDYTLEMNDSYGDGWNGAYVDVYINGVLDGGSPHSCAVSQTIDVISVPDGATVYLDYFAGSYEGEVTYSFIDAIGTTLFSDGTNPSTTNPVYGPLVLNCPAPPDDPCNATVLTIGCGVVTSSDNVGMSDSGIPAPSCGSYAGGDTWFSLVVPASGTVGFECFAGTLTDVSMAIYSTSGGCGGVLTELACNDNSGTGNMPLINSTTLTPGNTIYVRVWDNNNDQAGDYTIRVIDLSDLFCYTGSAVSTGSGCAQLTAASNNQNGSIWDANDVLDFTTDWSYDFKVNLGSSDGGADGICFVIQNDPAGLLASGTSGGSMGAGGIINSLIVEVDTYINSEDRNDGLPSLNCSTGPEWDHLDLWTGGSVNPGTCSSGARFVPNAVELLSGGSLYNIENGLNHTLRVSFVSGTQTFTATILDDAAVVTYGTISHSPVDPMVVFGTNTPYFGFTASTGGLSNVQTGCLAPEFIVLPITLLEFNLVCDDGKFRLDWTTASEMNNDYFTIERSIDGVNFDSAGQVLGAGNSDQLKEYSWIDKSPLPGVNYYRLKQTDFDGKFSYSKLKAVSCKGDVDFSVYPNPVLDKVMLTSTSELRIKYEIITMDGRIIKEGSFIGNQRIDLAELSSGAYFVRAISKDEIFQEKLIKK